MPSTEQKNLLSTLFIVLILALPFLFLYIASFNSAKQQSQMEREEFDYGGRPVQQMETDAIPSQLVLHKDKRIVVGKNGLVYKGSEGKDILIDFYLLEMDPEQPYLKKFRKKDAKKKMRIGSHTYRLVSANQNILVMKEMTD